MALRCLPPSVYQVGDMFYRSGGGWMEVFTLKPPIPSSEDDEPRELVMPPTPPDFDDPSPGRRQKGPVPALEAPLVHWVTRAGGRSHRKAVHTGDVPKGGSAAYGGLLGRAYCCGQLLVGRVNKLDRVCLVAYEEYVFEVMRYEVLVLERGRLEWVPCRNGYVPPSALPAGITLQATQIYAVRVSIHGMPIPGQIIKGERSCRVPYEKHELQFREYDVLTLRCAGDDRAAPTERMGPTDQEYEDFVEPKFCKPLDSPRRGKRDYTGAPIRRLCLPPLQSPEGEISDPGRNAGENVPGPSRSVASPERENPECVNIPKRFQALTRPRL